jgi:hypothetical protein
VILHAASACVLALLLVLQLLQVSGLFITGTAIIISGLFITGTAVITEISVIY